MEERTRLASTEIPESSEEFNRELKEIDALLDQIRREGWLEP